MSRDKRTSIRKVDASRRSNFEDEHEQPNLDAEDDEGEHGDDPARGDEWAAEDALARLPDGLDRVRVRRGVAVTVCEVVPGVPLAEIGEHEEHAREDGVENPDWKNIVLSARQGAGSGDGRWGTAREETHFGRIGGRRVGGW